MWPLAAAWYGIWSVIAFLAYRRDKRAAQRGLRRTPERTLHVFELLGGWPGALAARRVLRHKTRDGGFLLAFWLIVAVHAAAWSAWLLLG